MRRVERAGVSPPASLAGYHHDTCSWDDEPGRTRFHGAHKKELRSTLESMQAGCCAYCESPTFDDGHIEHFRRKNKDHFPELMFAWSNLFLSCSSLDHCGHYKDRRGSHYDPRDLVKPDDDDPNEYFYFHSSGDVRVRSGLDVVKARRASETIRVFHLDCGSLQAERRRAIKSYLRRDPDMLEAISEFEESLRLAFIDQELQATSNEPHSAVIRHFFEKHT